MRVRLAALFMLAVLPLAGERIWTLIQDRDHLIAENLEDLREFGEQVTLVQRESLASAVAVTQVLAREASRLMAEPVSCTTFLHRLTADLVGIQGAIITDADGIVRCATSRALMGVDLSDRPYARQAFASHRPAFSDLIRVRGTGTPTIAIAEAERDDKGIPVALAAVAVDLQWLSRISALTRLPKGAVVEVLDATGAVVTRTPYLESALGASFADHPLFQVLSRTAEGQTRAVGFDGVERFYAFLRVPGTTMRVLVGVPALDVTVAVDEQILLTVTLVICASIIMVLLAWWLSERMVVAPIHHLAQDVRDAGLDGGVAVNDPEVREFRPLVSAINELGQRLAERTAELRNHNGRLAALARTDGLTGLANRRTFDVQMSAEWVRSGDRGLPLGLIMVDVDHFKLFNDNQGHLAGDEALKAVARMLAAACAGTPHLPARYGGEEFVVLMPDTDLSGAAEFAETARRLVAALAIEHPSVPSRRLTASFGVAMEIPDAGSSPDSLISAADQALYEAKRLGRNRVSIARTDDVDL
ncbi:GGDEF domain-containing protein [Aquabacter sp. L1I39]|uniref:sensor domain-containing diguanylate cyclase n=1 Tax=Aquabacter sp. L1I39 TaxID=2820278 RepID=UPI001ADB3CCA|nr:sensor domain-containing diguanylate cyclase [Aquabacter sp. L1I39]QTL02947.1 GGDEF domain-containing protein [Aquabacter sp. L1I39]